VRVLRLCSVFETPDEVATRRGGRFDPIGGMQTHTAALTRAVDRLGVAQTVLTTRPPGSAAYERIGSHSAVVRVGLPVPVCRQLYAVAAARWLSRSDGTFDVVHAHQGEDIGVLLLARAASRRLAVPLVITVHTSVRHTLSAGNLRSTALHVAGGSMERRAINRADAVITLTERTAALMVADGLAVDRVSVVPSGYEPRLFADVAPDPEVAALAGRRVLYVGRLHPQKDVGTLVRAAAQLRTRHARVVIVGDGPERPMLERTVRDLGLYDAVTLLGAVPHWRVPAVLAAGDVLAMPSRYEELGSVLIEAMRAGLPVVASRTGGIPDLVSDGETGLLVPPGDPASMALALDRILGDPPLAARMRSNARLRAELFRWDALAERVRSAYDGVCVRSTCGGATDRSSHGPFHGSGLG
jgi:glycogen(starch) synthase